MLPRLVRCLTAAAFVLCLAPAARAVPDVQVLAVGANQSFKGSLKSLKFAELDAKRFAEAMETVGLVPTVRATVLTNATVKDFREAFRSLVLMDEREGKQEAAARKFVFYFSGHSDDKGLHLKDGFIGKEELHDLLSSITAHTKVAILDSCFSGGITSKGVEEAPAFELPRMEFDEPSGSVFLTASSARQFAYESDDLGGSIFTHHLLDGLYGEADGNGDGIVTVDELYQYVYRNTKWQSLNYPSQSAQEPEYIAKLQGQGAIVLSFPAKTNSRLVMARDLKGEITIGSPKGIQFFKVVKIEGQEKTIQLPVGAYQLSVRDGKQVGEGHVKIEPAKLAFLANADVSWRSDELLATKAAKGETSAPVAMEREAAPAARQDVSEIGLLLGAHSGFMKPAPAGPFIEVNYSQVLTGFSRLSLLWGWALNFHHNEVSSASSSEDRWMRLVPPAGQESASMRVTTDSTAGYATATIRYRSPWHAVPAVVGIVYGYGETYHDQKYRFNDSKSISQGGAAPGQFYGVALDVRTASGRRVGVVLRNEIVETNDVSDTSAKAEAKVLALSTTF